MLRAVLHARHRPFLTCNKALCSGVGKNLPLEADMHCRTVST